MSTESNKLTLEKLFLGKARIKTLDVLLKYGEINVTKIIRESHLNHAIVMRHLQTLQSYGLIHEVTRDTNRFFVLNYNHPTVKIITQLKTSIEQIPVAQEISTPLMDDGDKENAPHDG